MARYALLFLLILGLSGGRALAQEGGGLLPSAAGLFGKTSESASKDRLELTAAFSGGLDSQLPLGVQPVLQQSDPRNGGFSSIVMATAGYNRKRRRADVSGNFVTSLRYFPGLAETSSLSGSAGLGAHVRLGRRSALEANQTASYSPSYLYQLFPGVVPPEAGDAPTVAPDYRIDQTSSYSRATSIGITFGSGRANQIGFDAVREQTDFKDAAQPDVDVATGRGRWSHGIGRTGTVFTELEYRRGDFGLGARTSEKRLRVGAEYAPALSRSRRASIGVNLATSALNIPSSASLAVVTGTIHKIEGDASVSYPLLFKWSIGGSFRRAVENVAVLGSPVISNAARIAMAGRLSYRIDLSASAGYVSGASVLVRAHDRFDTYVGNARVRYAFTRSLAIYGEYLHYRYDLRGSATLAPSAPRLFVQDGVRVGVTLWARPMGR